MTEPALKKLSTSDAKLSSLWESITCGDLIAEKKDHKVISIGSNESVTSACEILAKHGISSAPIYDKAQDMVLGVFDFRDLAACLVNVVGEMDAETMGKKNLALKDILRHEKAQLAADLSQHDKFHSVQTTAKLTEALQFFGLGQHRVFVVDKEKHIVGVLSQSDALQYLHKHINETGLTDCTLDALGIVRPREQVVHIDQEQSVLSALKAMQNYSVTSVCVSQNKQLAGNFSMGDVKYLLKLGRLRTLLLPLREVLQTIRLAKDKERRYQSQVPVFTAHLDMTLGKAVGRMAATRTHRLWITDNKQSIQGVMTLSDVLKTLTPIQAREHWKAFPLIKFVPAV